MTRKQVFKSVKKRDGRIVPFKKEKVTEAIFKAAEAVGGKDRRTAERLADKVIAYLHKSLPKEEIPSVERIQDAVEKVLIEEGHARTAKAFILYRNKRTQLRDMSAFLTRVHDIIQGYLMEYDWRSKENSNTSYSLSGLQAHISGAVIAEYTLNNIYPKEVSDAHRNGDFHIHDLGNGVFSGYSFYRNETVIARKKSNGQVLALSLEQLFDLVKEEKVKEKGFEIKYTNDFEVLDEKGWSGIKRVLRHKTDKPLVSFNTLNGHNLIVTEDHPFITLKEEKKAIACKECGSGNISKNRTNRVGKDYFKCSECSARFSAPVQVKPDKKERKEVLAEEIKLNNYVLTPQIELNLEKREPSISEEEAWLIGLFIAEGYTKDQRYLFFELSPESIECERVVNCLKQSNAVFNAIFPTRPVQEGNLAQVQVSRDRGASIRVNPESLSTEMQGLLESVRPYAENKNLPIDFLQLPDEIIGAMVSGVIDGDGVVRNDDQWVSRANIRVTSKTLLSQIQFWLETQEINSSLISIDSFGKREYKGIPIESKKQLYSLTVFIPKEKAHLFRQCHKLNHEFKYSKPLQKKKASNFRKIERIENDSEYVYDITTSSHSFLCNGILSHNCAGWSIKQLLAEGFNGVEGRIAAKPAKHFNAALGQIVNFFGTLQNEWAGAQAFSSFDTFLAPLAAKDNLNYKKVKQSLQEFVFAVNSTSRWGNQVPFTNITLDWKVPEDMREQKVIYGGETLKETYSDFQDEMDMINRAFIEIMMKGDMNGRIFTFPIPTYNITREFEWDTENALALFEMTAKYGTPYFQNFVNSSLKPSDVRSMCCRLQLNVKELKAKTGGLFGSGELTGSVGVVTINLPRAAYLSRDKEEFIERIETLADYAKESLEIKRKQVSKNMKQGLLPYSQRYLGGLNNHFSTIGVVGGNEAALNLLGKDIGSKEGKKLALDALNALRKKLQEFQKESGNIYNLEATPAEGTSYRLARIDKKKFPDIISSGQKAPYYTNSTQLPVGYTDDIFGALLHQDDLQTLYTGGTVLHGFIGERIDTGESCKKLVKKIAWNFRLPYYTITPTFSICPVHGYIKGEHHSCPHSV